MNAVLAERDAAVKERKTFMAERDAALQKIDKLQAQLRGTCIIIINSHSFCIL